MEETLDGTDCWEGVTVCVGYENNIVKSLTER